MNQRTDESEETPPTVPMKFRALLSREFLCWIVNAGLYHDNGPQGWDTFEFSVDASPGPAVVKFLDGGVAKHTRLIHGWQFKQELLKALELDVGDGILKITVQSSQPTGSAAHGIAILTVTRRLPPACGENLVALLKQHWERSETYPTAVMGGEGAEDER